MKQCMATTMDNKFNPFTQYKQWFEFDDEHGYKTNELVAFFSTANSNMEKEEYNKAVSDGIDRLLELNPLGRHMKVYEDEADVLIPLANKAYESSKED